MVGFDGHQSDGGLSEKWAAPLEVNMSLRRFAASELDD